MGFSVFFIVISALASWPVVSFCTAGPGSKWGRWPRLAANAALALLCGFLCGTVRMLALAMLHLLVLLSISRLAHWCFCLLRKKRTRGWLYKSGLIPLALTAALLVFGYCNMNTVHQTAYRISSDKLNRNYRVAFLSDVHYGTVQDPDLLNKKIQEINAAKPDLVILGGDMLDESASLEDMQACFAALGKLSSTYGSYFVYGNHDRQRYSGAPEYTEAQMREAMEANGIALLCEESVLIEDDLQLLGREDMSARADRLNPEALPEATDARRFLLTIDHQPTAAQENALLGTDLQLSGHTHNGQIFPLGHFDFLFQGYVYGEYSLNGMTLLVSSGFAGWGFPVRTQGICEYLMVELTAGVA